jgi:hypothetical protein
VNEAPVAPLFAQAIAHRPLDAHPREPIARNVARQIDARGELDEPALAERDELFQLGLDAPSLQAAGALPHGGAVLADELLRTDRQAGQRGFPLAGDH